MQVLPPKTDLPATPIPRRHHPEAGAYRTYRPCLRWEFGFTCAFCLLHEADLTAHGIEGSGLTGIEHHIPRSHEAALIDVYRNCLYVCRYCNSARSNAPNTDSRGRTLLDPCVTAWSLRFEQASFLLKPRDPDAEYTWEAYDLGDPRKTQMRRSRADAVERCLRVLREGPDRIRRLLEIADRVGREDRLPILDAAETLQCQVIAARKDVARFRIVPEDADRACRCVEGIALELPPFLAAQAIEVPAK